MAIDALQTPVDLTPLRHIQKGDHVQLFGGKHDPDTGAPRQVMTIWRGSKLIWFGPPMSEVLEDPRVRIRQIEVRLPLAQHREFRVESSPLS
jgi:hypothetical protein